MSRNSCCFGRERAQDLHVSHKLPAARQQKQLGILCGTAIIAILICTLWPFNPLAPNRVAWLQETNGIQFGDAGVVISKAPLRAEETGSGKFCSLELLVRPAGIEGVHTILNFYTPKNPRQFLVRQWADDLLVSQDLLDTQGRLERAAFDVDHAFQQGTILLVTITSGPNGTVVYMDGSQAKIFPEFTISQRDLAGQIVMGTSAVSYRPWPGEVHGLAIYSKELTPTEVLRNYNDWTDGRGVNPAGLDEAIARYTFIERAGREIHNEVVSGPALEIPRSFGIPHKPLLESPVKGFEENTIDVNDLLLNIAGFVPLGFIVCAYLAWTRSRRQAILCTILFGGTLSLVIEVLQFYISARHSDMMDIITNTLGTALGAVLARPSIFLTIFGRTRLITAYGKSISQPD